MGRDGESETVMDKAAALPGSPVMGIHQYGLSLLAAGKKEKAFELFKMNRRVHPEDAFVTYVGLARRYTAIGDKKNAIANWEIALRNLPENQKQNLQIY